MAVKVNGIVIDPSGGYRRVTVETLREMQAVVGGDIEPLSIPSRRATMYCNEFGKKLGLQMNDEATAICFAYNAGLHPDDYIVGPVLILGEPDTEGEDTDIPEVFANELMKKTGVRASVISSRNSPHLN